MDCESSTQVTPSLFSNVEKETTNHTTRERSMAQECVKKRRLTSDIWSHFKMIGKSADGKAMGECNYCHQEFVMGTNSYGTFTLTRHLSACKKRPQVADHADKAKGIDNDVLRRMFAMVIIANDLPFEFVEYESLRDAWRYLNPNVRFIDRHEAEAGVCKIYKDEKDKLKLALTRILSRVCLTLDVWTGSVVDRYVCLTAQYVDENWKLNRKLLSFASVPHPYGRIELAKKIHGCLKDWGLEKKVFSLTMDDDDSANDNVQDTLKELFYSNSSLLCEGEFFHVKCCARFLNVLVKEGLEVICGLLEKIRESLKHVQGSEEKEGLFGFDLRMDVPDQWRSTYVMLKSAIKNRRVFSNLQLSDDNYKHCPSYEEWTRGEKMCRFLKPLYDISDLFSCPNYRTSSMYFMYVGAIACLLKENMEKEEDEVMKDMARKMQTGFYKYWDHYSVVLAMGAAVDPRFKFEYLKFCFGLIDPSTCQKKMDHVRMKLNMLFEQYKRKPMEASSSSCNGESNASSSSRKRPNCNGEKTCTTRQKSYLDVFLEEAVDRRKDTLDMDVLEYWKNRKEQFGELATMACDLLSIPITTGGSESSFSVGVAAFSKYRARVLPTHVQDLLCVRNWFYGYELQANDDNGDAKDGEGNGSSDN